MYKCQCKGRDTSKGQPWSNPLVPQLWTCKQQESWFVIKVRYIYNSFVYQINQGGSNVKIFGQVSVTKCQINLGHFQQRISRFCDTVKGNNNAKFKFSVQTAECIKGCNRHENLEIHGSLSVPLNNL